jgi:long-subunit acyl-CoA synthetase (AMP-forming)
LEKTIEAFDYDTEEDRKAGINGWLNTGDVAIIHPNGAI